MKANQVIAIGLTALAVTLASPVQAGSTHAKTSKKHGTYLTPHPRTTGTKKQTKHLTAKSKTHRPTSQKTAAQPTLKK